LLFVAILVVILGILYFIGYEPTNLVLNNGEYSFNNDLNVLNQSGRSEPNSWVKINGNSAFVDQNGNFYCLVDIHNGSNIINVTAKAPFKSIKTNIASVKRTETPNHIDVYYSMNNSYVTS
jgi:hypothetical protein